MRDTIRYLCVAAVMALGCSESFKPDVSTETGNPPAIDSRKIALVVTQDEVHVQGEAGAIMPAEADVEVTIVRTQDVTRGEVEDDGSFDVLVEATRDDVFEVRAVLGAERSASVIVDRGGATVGEGEDGALSCEQQAALGSAVLEAAIALADRRCEVDADCMDYSPSADCFGGCPGTFLSAEGLRSVEDTAAIIDGSVCATFEEDGCARIAPDCPGIDRFPSCNAGRCETELTMPECDDCVSSVVGWRITSPGTLPALISNERHEISACNQLTERTVDRACARDVPQCQAEAPASIAALNALIATAEVQAALAEGQALGEPEDTAGYWYNISIGGSAFTYRTCARASREGCAPRGPIDDLIDMLEQLAQENACTLQPLDRCNAPFDPGGCDANIPVLWHDPATGECVEMSYGGCGGNDNRHTSLGACLAACPAPDQETPCPQGRQPITYCYECGPPLGNCDLEGPFCTQECENDDDCADGNWPESAAGVCDASTGLCQPPSMCL